MKILGAFTAFPKLADLPRLVRKQRRLEAKIAPLEPLVDQEKVVRKTIDALLVDAGVGKSEGVECLGYEVCHNERAGASFINPDKLVLLLTGAGFTEADAAAAIAWLQDPGTPASVRDRETSQRREGPPMTDIELKALQAVLNAVTLIALCWFLFGRGSK
jgi:hypothetical protein